MESLISQTSRRNRASWPPYGRGQRASWSRRPDGSPVGQARGREPSRQPRFDEFVPENGYRWWYLDGLSSDGEHGLTVIGFVGSVFSPYYALARRRGPAQPENHCAINVALYGKAGHHWSMTERGRAGLKRSADRFQVGPSAMRWQDGTLVIDVHEITVPIPRRLVGEIRLTPKYLTDARIELEALGQHFWHPVAPHASIEVNFESPRLSWTGTAYHDMNWGSVPLEDSFTEWNWARAETEDGAYAVYDALRRDGSRKAFALTFDEHGNSMEAPVPPHVPLPRCFWGMKRSMPSEGKAELVTTLEDAPFYSRSLVRAVAGGKPFVAVHESLSLDRFRMPLIQAMLPFRMPRRRR
jgi:carotenoid 1,2-hydratase